MSFITVIEGASPLIVSIPHAGLEIPSEIEAKLISPWLSRKDADWHLEQLYAFVAELDATLIQTRISRTVIDVNRDPSGVSLYPGQATTGLCPLTTFDGENLYKNGYEPTQAEISHRKETYFQPFHDAIEKQIQRLKAKHGGVRLYDCHSIRSQIPRLFAGELPHFNIGTNEGASCAPHIAKNVQEICAASGLSHVLNGRFKGGYITRHYGNPQDNIHAVQMEISCRAYMEDPSSVNETNWPTPFNADYSPQVNKALRGILSHLSTPIA